MDKKYTIDYFEKIHDTIAWFDDGTLNAAYNILDHNIEVGNGNKVALLHESIDGKVTEFTFFSLVKKSNKIANYLKTLDVKKGDHVFLFLPRIPELYYSFIGVMKMGAVVGTLFTAFQEEALLDRLSDAQAKVIFTTKNLLPRINAIKEKLPDLKHILVVDEDAFQNDFDLQSDKFEIEHTKPEDYAFMLYTSGTTGKPKGIVHAHYAIIQQIASAKTCLDLQENDILWCTADPGWITGVVYSIMSNWALGITTVVYEGKFSPEAWYKVIEKHKVTVFYTAPTAIRMLMTQGTELTKQFDLSSLRHLASVGEPLNPEAISWGKEAFGSFFHDTWFQTETGSIMIANTPEFGIHPGSMGKPLPWVQAEILDSEGKMVPDNDEGNLCLKPYWPSLMRTVWGNNEKYEGYFQNGWYVTGDKARRDEKGYFWFIGRADDIINSSGERIGPFEVESCLLENRSVSEAAVVGKPDQLRGEIVKAFIVLKQDVFPSEELKSELQQYVKHHLSEHAYPREIDFVEKLPKTESGKILRRVLKEQE